MPPPPLALVQVLVQEETMASPPPPPPSSPPLSGLTIQQFGILVALVHKRVAACMKFIYPSASSQDVADAVQLGLLSAFNLREEYYSDAADTRAFAAWLIYLSKQAMRTGWRSEARRRRREEKVAVDSERRAMNARMDSDATVAIAAAQDIDALWHGQPKALSEVAALVEQEDPKTDAQRQQLRRQRIVLRKHLERL